MTPITIDLSGLSKQFGLSQKAIDELTETCVNEVTAIIYTNWQALAKKNLHSTLPEYLHNLHTVDKGRFAKQIILTGILPSMVENGASPFDMKNSFEKSKKVKYTVPVYNAKGKQVYAGGDWYLTIPFRIGTPGIVGQAGFSNEMPQEIYDIMLQRPAQVPLKESEIPDPYNVPKSRAAIMDEVGDLLYDEYQHKNSIFEGLVKNSSAYENVVQNTYGTFRRVGKNSDPLSWIHKGIKAYHLADKAVEMTNVDDIVQNEVLQFLDEAL